MKTGKFIDEKTETTLRKKVVCVKFCKKRCSGERFDGLIG